MSRSIAYLLIILISNFSFLLSSCSDISEDERLTVVSLVEKDTTAVDTAVVNPGDDIFAPMARHVLIEDFTGQNCVNCPNATDRISQIQKKYDHETVVAVAIHSGPLGVKVSKSPLGLATDLGDTYYNFWKIESQPMGVIDRSGGLLYIDSWSDRVDSDLGAFVPPVNLWVDTTVPDASASEAASSLQPLNIQVRLAGREQLTGRLQLWLTEDSIVAPQKMPDGSANKNYVHNHVLRDAVNGDWGDELTIAQGEEQTLDFTYTPQSTWNISHLAVVTFITNADGTVVQVVRKSF